MISQFELLITVVMQSRLITMTRLSVVGKARVWNKLISIANLGETLRTNIYCRIYKLGI